MSSQTVEVTRIITEYKEFNIGNVRTEHAQIIQKECDDLTNKLRANTDENVALIDRMQKLHEEHKNLQKENNAEHEGKKATLNDIVNENNSYDAFAKAAAAEHAGLRDDIAGKEHPLRVLQNEVAILGLENKNLQLVIDTEAALRDAKAQAEISAVTTVNTDLKDQTQRFENDINEEKARKNDAERLLRELDRKHFLHLDFAVNLIKPSFKKI